MKNLLIALILSASSYAFGQEKKNMHYKENHQLEMHRLNKNSKIYIENKYPPLYFEIRKINLDSLIQIAKNAYKKLDISIEPHEAKTIVLELNMSQPKEIVLPDAIQTKISVQKRPNTDEAFGLTKSNEMVRIKNQYDSLVFKLKYYALPSYLLDSVANQEHKFPKEGYDLLLSVVTPDFEKISIKPEIEEFYWFLRNSEKSLKKRNKIVDKAEVYWYENSYKNSLITFYVKNPTTLITGNFSSSIGWINNQFVPSFGGSFTFNFKKIEIGFITETFFIPELIPNKGKSSPLSMSGLFVNFSSKTNYYSNYLKNNKTQSGFGYQIGKIEETENINPIFNGWTSRAFLRVPINKYFSIEPEMMGGFFNKKGVNTSLRLRFNL